MNVTVITKDGHVWNINEAVVKITQAMIADADITLDFNHEGPDISQTELDSVILNLANVYHYDPKRITVLTANQVQTHDTFNVQYTTPFHLVEHTYQFALDYTKQIDKHFGIFVGRSNGPRLHLASHLYNEYKNQSLITYHYNVAREFHKDNVGLEELIKMYNKSNLTVETYFLQACPIIENTIHSVDHIDINCEQAVFIDDKEQFVKNYTKFFAEIVCETCYNGNTFFPTEKTWRPILLETPFIVQGPQWYLRRLHDMGFQTFDRWWDEGYSEDPADYQLEVIKDVVKDISARSVEDLSTMYKEMQSVLKHNKQCLLELTKDDFAKQR
jgi:hypothetical protein|tara:strand:+ start:138 stop:1124 length:987 start_codon:yes stop_codon:yes gene_type:complete